MLILKDVALRNYLLSFLSSDLHLPRLCQNFTDQLNIEPKQLCCFSEELEDFHSFIFKVCLTLHVHDLDQLNEVTLLEEIARLNDYREGIQEFALDLHRPYIGLLSLLQTGKFGNLTTFYNFKQFVIDFDLFGINTLSINLTLSQLKLNCILIDIINSLVLLLNRFFIESILFFSLLILDLLLSFHTFS